jgi:hypothetical protein
LSSPSTPGYHFLAIVIFHDTTDFQRNKFLNIENVEGLVKGHKIIGNWSTVPLLLHDNAVKVKGRWSNANANGTKS